MEQDKRVMGAYLSHDPNVTAPVIEPIAREGIEFLYQAIDVEKEFLDHPSEFFTLLNRNVYMQNMIHDHPEYFDTLPEATMQKLQKAMDMGAFLSCYIVAPAGTYGINFNIARMLELSSLVEASQKQLHTLRIQAQTVLK